MEEHKIIDVVKDTQSDYEVLRELTRKELISDLIMDVIFDALYLDSKGKPDFNRYDLKESLLVNLVEKYDKKRFDEVIARLKELEEKNN